MRWENTKDVAEIKANFASNEVDLEFRNNALASITIGKVKITSPYSNLDILIPAKPKKEKKYKVAFEFVGSKYEKIMDDRYEAEVMLSELRGKADNYDTVKIEEVEVDVVGDN